MPNSQARESKFKNRVLAIIEPHYDAARLLRAAKRKAQAAGIEWEVVFVESRALEKSLLEVEREQILQSLTMARNMGAIVTHIHAKTLMRGIRDVLKEREKMGINITTITVGSSGPRKRLLNFRSSLDRKLQRQKGWNYQVIVISMVEDLPRRKHFSSVLKTSIKEIMLSLITVAIATLIIETLRYFVPDAIGAHNRNKTLIYVMACGYMALRFGLLAGIITSVTSFLTLKFFYIAPYYSLIIQDQADAVNLTLFLCSGIILSLFGSREYDVREAISHRAERFHSLLRLHRITLNKESAGEAVKVLDEELTRILGTRMAFFLPSITNEAKLENLTGHTIELNSANQKALDICWQESKTTGVGSPYDPGCDWRFEPMLTSQDEIGVLGVEITDNVELDSTFTILVSSIADQSALILERLQVGQLAEATRMRAEREKLRSLLLSSVSHDLKTPLASVIGSLSVFRSMSEKLSAEHRLTLINTALEEAQRLDNFITNILDMTRIESGQVEMKQDWARPEEIIADVLKRLRYRLHDHPVNIAQSMQDIEVCMDTIMTSQVIQNLLDNAAKYTPAGTKIDIIWNADDRGFTLKIRDHGNGIPEEHLEKVFDKYSRINRADRQVAGTGLGLAIAKATLQAQDGSIVAQNHPEGGAMFIITLPRWRLNTNKTKVA